MIRKKPKPKPKKAPKKAPKSAPKKVGGTVRAKGRPPTGKRQMVGAENQYDTGPAARLTQILPVVEPTQVIPSPYLHDKRAANEWMWRLADHARATGLKHHRVTAHPDDPKRMLFEAWPERPENEGPVKWPSP